MRIFMTVNEALCVEDVVDALRQNPSASTTEVGIKKIIMMHNRQKKSLAALVDFRL